MITTFTSRLSGIPELARQLPALRSGLRAWTAWPSWPPPDLPSDALIRVLTGHDGPVRAGAIAPDGTWLAITGGSDGTVRTWAADGIPRATLTGHNGPVNAVAIAPDGTLAGHRQRRPDGADLGRRRGAQLKRYSDTGRR